MSDIEVQAVRAAGADIGVVVFEPATELWLVLRPMAVEGMPTLEVVSEHPERARAEAAGGLHASPARHWLLQDELGWHLSRGHGWTQEVSTFNWFAEAEARQRAANDPGATLLVLRADGRVTCPDVAP